MNEYDIDLAAFDASVREALERDDYDADKLLASEDWTKVHKLMHVGGGFSVFSVSTEKNGEPLVPALYGFNNSGGITACPIPPLLAPSVLDRKMTMLMIPGNLHVMDVDVAVLTREAWTVVLNKPEEEVDDNYIDYVRTIQPSKDDRRVSTLVYDVITPDWQFIVNYKINEGKDRSVSKEPFQTLVVKAAGVMQTTDVPDLARKPFPK